MLSFELAFKYRNPVVIVGDGYLGQMTGKVRLPGEMVVPGIPEWAVFGDRSHRGNLICSINLSEIELEQHNVQLNEKYDRMTAEEQRADLYRCDDAEILARGLQHAVAARQGRHQGAARRGASRWASSAPSRSGPSRSTAFRTLLDRVEHLVVVEASSGQLEDELRLALSHAGCARPTADEPRAPHGRDPPVAGRDRRARA